MTVLIIAEVHGLGKELSRVALESLEPIVLPARVVPARGKRGPRLRPFPKRTLVRSGPLVLQVGQTDRSSVRIGAHRCEPAPDESREMLQSPALPDHPRPPQRVGL